MFGYISLLWVNRTIDEAKVQSYVPKFITQEEKDLIIVTPQK